MIKKESLIKLLVKNKVVKDEAAAIALIDATEEQDLTIPELHIFEKSDLDARDKAKYQEGETAGTVTFQQSLFDKYKVEAAPNSKKDIDAFISNFQKKLLGDANKTTDEKVKEREADIEKLRANITEYEQRYSALETKTKQAEERNRLLGMLHPKRDPRLTDDEYIQLIKNKYEFAEVDGKTFVKNLATGEIEKDSVRLQPLQPQDVIKNHFETAKWIQTEPTQTKGGGRGGSDSKFITASATSFSEFKELAKERGIANLNGEKASALLKEVTKNNPNFDFSK